MKWIFAVLLVLSIALFAVMQWGGALTGAGKSSLLSAELNPEQIKLLDIPTVKQAAVSEPTPMLPVVAASAPVVASAPSPIAPLMLAPVTAVTKPLPPSAPPAAKVTAKICMEWGEFSGTDLALTEKALAESKLREKLTHRSVEYESGYWVYLPPSANKTALNKRVAAVKTAGIEDFFVVKESTKWNNAISLGVFKTEEAAKLVLAKLKKRGFHTAKMGVRNHKLKFIVFVIKGLDADNVATLGKLQKDFANSELKKIACAE